MDPLIKQAFFQTLGFLLVALLTPWLFVHVEHTEKDNKEEKYHLLHSLYDSMASKYNMTIEEFNNFSNVAFEALSVPKPRWTYLNAADFVVQAITTIGYGYITPQTRSGQILCIFVSLLGIPITLLALKSVGELIAKLVNASVTKFEKKILKRAEPKQIETKSAVILFSFMIGSMIVAGHVATTNVGDWTFVEGVYFWFITFSTIGFGDYVIREPITRIKKFCVNDFVYQENRDVSKDNARLSTTQVFTFWLFRFGYLICLCIVSSVLNSIMFALEERRCRPRCRGCFAHKTEDHESSEQYNPPQQSETGIFNMTHLSTNKFGFREGRQEIPPCLKSWELIEDREPEVTTAQLGSANFVLL